MHIYIKNFFDEINKKQLVPERDLYSRIGKVETPWVNIQRTDKGEFFRWHIDYNVDEQRLIAFIYYLNTRVRYFIRYLSYNLYTIYTILYCIFF